MSSLIAAMSGAPARVLVVSGALEMLLTSLLGFVMLMCVMSLNGFVNGLMQPSRDMIVRAVTPEGQVGKVFGFVTTGFNIGGIIAPLLFGWVMDAGHPRAVFFLVCGLSLLAIVTLIPNFVRRRATA